MKALGFAAVALTVVSFLTWFVNWAYWTYQTAFVTYDSTTYESQKVIRYVMQGFGIFSSVTEYLAILLIAVGLIALANRSAKI